MVGAAGEVPAIADIARDDERDAHRRFDMAHGAERAGIDDRLHARRQRVIAVVERLHQDPAAALRRLDHRARLVGVGGERLLAQHVLACAHGPDAPLGVQAVGQRIVDGVDLADRRSARRTSRRRADAVLARERSARAGSRAATATIAASGTWRAGRMSAIGAMRAAPRMPMRRGGGGSHGAHLTYTAALEVGNRRSGPAGSSGAPTTCGDGDLPRRFRTVWSDADAK